MTEQISSNIWKGLIQTIQKDLDVEFQWFLVPQSWLSNNSYYLTKNVNDNIKQKIIENNS